MDGAKEQGEKDMEYFFDIWFDLIHQLQPEAVIFSDAGPDVRWVGDEAGVAGVSIGVRQKLVTLIPCIHVQEINGGMIGYLLNVMSPSDLVGFGMHQKFQNLHCLFLTSTTN